MYEDSGFSGRDLDRPTIRRSTQWARQAGIPVVNAGDGRKPDAMSDEDALKTLGDRLAQILEEATRCEVHLAIEPHGTFSLTADGLEKVSTHLVSPRKG